MAANSKRSDSCLVFFSLMEADEGVERNQMPTSFSATRLRVERDKNKANHIPASFSFEMVARTK